MQASIANLRREQRKYTARCARKAVIANLAQEWEKSSFAMERKQASIAQGLAAVAIAPARKGVRFHPHLGG